MNIHEYQAKELLAKFGVACPAGIAALSVEEAVAAAKQLARPALRGESRRYMLADVARASSRNLVPMQRAACVWPSIWTRLRPMPRTCWATRW